MIHSNHERGPASIHARSMKILFSFGIAGLLMIFQNCGKPPGSSLSNFSSNQNNDGNGSNSANATSPPSTPSGLSGTAVSAAQVNLTWSDTSNNESGFKVMRSSALSGPFFSGGMTPFTVVNTTAYNTTSYSDTGLAPGTTYFYQIVATNSVGDSSPCASITVITPAAPSAPPTAPSNLRATASQATIIELNWTDNSNNEDYFEIDRSNDGGATFTRIAAPGVNSTTFEDINLNPATAYTYKIRAINSAGNSSFAPNASATTLTATNTSSFTYVNNNIIQPNCVSCHNSVQAVAGYNFSTYNSIRSAVSPGNPGGSPLYTSMTGNMPPGAPLSQTQLNQVSSWISAGAANN